MNDIYQDLYYEDSLQCINEGKSDAWTWEKRYAELIIRECLSCLHWDERENVLTHFGMEE